MHEQHLNLLGVVDEEFAQTVGHGVSVLAVGPESDGRHGSLTLEAASVNMIGQFPAALACECDALLDGGDSLRAPASFKRPAFPKRS